MYWIYYVWRNLIYYRVERKIDPAHLVVIQQAQTKGIRHAVADSILATVGLKIVQDDQDTVPWYIPLSRIQKRRKELVAKYGYKIGLT